MYPQTKLTIPKPLNDQLDYNIYFNLDEYISPYLGEQEIRNCFLSFNSVVLRKGWFLEPNSVYSDPVFLPVFKKRAREQMVASCILGSVPLLKTRERKLILVTQPWVNFYHWLLESMPRIIQCRSYWKDHKILIQPSTLEEPYVKESLALFPELELLVPEADTNIWAKSILLPALRPDCAIYNKELLFDTRNEILSRIKAAAVNPSLKLFVVRNPAMHRHITNIAELEPIITKAGFTIFDMENFTFEEQVNLFRNATHVVSQHGAALSNIIFAPHTCKVLELHKKVEKDTFFSIVYWTLAGVMGCPYYSLICDSSVKDLPYGHASIVVDPVKLEKILSIMTAG